MKKNLQDYIAIYKAIDPSICKQIIDDSNKAKWVKHNYNHPITQKSTIFEDDFEVSYQDKYIDYLNNKIKDCVNDYLTNVVFVSFELKQVSPIRFNRYQTGTNMKFHHDHIHTLFDGEKKGIPILSILGLLNNDFEGGDFLMFDGKKVQLETGDIILFPSNFLYPHSVTTVTKGTRYSFISWGF
jgi:predicted 2-oxoglutarate/Fe(II)-dependent dioxygenase YbiX